MRDADFYFQLGFEHGYESGKRSYERDADYVEGYARGQAFRAIAPQLVPAARRDADGRVTVTFAGLSLRPTEPPRMQ